MYKYYVSLNYSTKNSSVTNKNFFRKILPYYEIDIYLVCSIVLNRVVVPGFGCVLSGCRCFGFGAEWIFGARRPSSDYEDRSHWDCPVSVFGNVEAARQTLEKKSAHYYVLLLLPRHHTVEATATATLAASTNRHRPFLALKSTRTYEENSYTTRIKPAWQHLVLTSQWAKPRKKM